jgi:hypothetical protein
MDAGRLLGSTPRLPAATSRDELHFSFPCVWILVFNKKRDFFGRRHLESRASHSTTRIPVNFLSLVFTTLARRRSGFCCILHTLRGVFRTILCIIRGIAKLREAFAYYRALVTFNLLSATLKEITEHCGVYDN